MFYPLNYEDTCVTHAIIHNRGGLRNSIRKIVCDILLNEVRKVAILRIASLCLLVSTLVLEGCRSGLSGWS